MPDVGDEAPGAESRSVTILEWDAGVVHLLGRGPWGEIEVIAEMSREGDTLILRGAHVEEPGAGSLGISELRQLGRLLGRQQGVRRVFVFGGTRTTGANPGHSPRPVVIEVD